MSASLARLTHVQARDITIQYVQHGSTDHWAGVRLVGSVPQLATGLQRRRTVLDSVDVLGESGPPAGRYIVSGMGGVGKTQLAAAFVRDLVQRKLVSLVVWAAASSRTGVLTSYMAAAASVGVGADDPEQACARLLGWLASTSCRWAIVLDDLSDPADLQDLWPPDTETGITVVTTRRRDASLVMGRKVVYMDVFSADQAPDLRNLTDGRS